MRGFWAVSVIVSILVLSISFSVDSAFAVTEDTKRTAFITTAIDFFGTSVSISGDTAIVGAPSDDSDNSGAAYVFTRSGGTWTQQAKLTASDGEGDDKFGFSVSISGDTVIVGAPRQDNGVRRSDSGAAYVFVKPTGGWTDSTQTAKLTALVADDTDDFGFSVSISGDTAIVGSPLDDDAESGNGNVGSAYVFVKPTGGWTDSTQTAKLRDSDLNAGDNFGFSVFMLGDTAIVGTSQGDRADPGAAHVFVKPTGGWTDSTQTAKLTASDGAERDLFGFSVSMSGDTVIVGAVEDDDAGSRSGSAYVFVKPTEGWTDSTQTAKLTASDAALGDLFGTSVSISGDTAIVGARSEGGGEGATATGSAYVFVKPTGGWTDSTQTVKLTASDAEEDDEFGTSVSISGDTAIVGVPLDDDEESESDSGSAYFFDLESGRADLQVTQSVSQKNVVPDSPFHYSIEVSHKPESTSDAKMVVVGSTLIGPGKIDDFEPKTNCMKLSITIIECKWDEIKIGIPETIDVFVLVDPNDEPFGKVFTNVVDISDSDDDPTGPSNFIRIDEPKVSAQADLTVSQTVSKTHVLPGEEIKYFIEVTNLENSNTETDAVKVTLIIQITWDSPNLRFVPDSIVLEPETNCTIPRFFGLSGILIECNWDRIKIGESETRTITFVAGDPAGSGLLPFPPDESGVYSNTVSVSSLENMDLGDPENNVSQISEPEVSVQADLTVSQTVSIITVLPGEEIKYFIKVTNLKNSNTETDAVNVNLFSTIFWDNPALRFIPDSMVLDSDAFCFSPRLIGLSSMLIECNWDRIKIGESETLTITFVAENTSLGPLGPNIFSTTRLIQGPGGVYSNSVIISGKQNIDLGDPENNLSQISGPTVVPRSFPDTVPVPVGDDVLIEFTIGTTGINTIDATFPEVSVGGTFTFEFFSDPLDSPIGFEIAGRIFDISTDIPGPIEIIIGYDDLFLTQQQELELTIQHFNEPTLEWDDIPTIVDPVVNELQFTVVLASPFGIFSPSSVSGGGGGGDSTPPSFNTVSIFGAKTEQDDGTFGFGAILQKEIKLVNSMPTAIVETGTDITIRVLLYENSGKQALEHITLYTNIRGPDSKVSESDTYLRYNNGKITLEDPNEIFSNGNISFVERGANVEAVFELTAEKTMPLSDIIIRAWDNSRNSQQAKFVDEIEIVPGQEQTIEFGGTIGQSEESESEMDLVALNDILPEWAGYSKESVTDSEFLSQIGIEGQQIPSWFKNKVAKWVIDGTVTQQELVNAMKYFENTGLLT